MPEHPDEAGIRALRVELISQAFRQARGVNPITGMKRERCQAEAVAWIFSEHFELWAGGLVNVSAARAQLCRDLADPTRERRRMPYKATTAEQRERDRLRSARNRERKRAEREARLA